MSKAIGPGEGCDLQAQSSLAFSDTSWDLHVCALCQENIPEKLA